MDIYACWNRLSNKVLLPDVFTPHSERELARVFDHTERSLEMVFEDQLYMQVTDDWGPR